MRTLLLTKRDQLILRALSLQVRLFGQRQLAEAFWQGDVANARRRMKLLTNQQLVERKQILARPLPDLLSPIAVWQPGNKEPDPGSIAFKLQSRWRYRTLRSTVAYLATRKTTDHFGGSHHRPLSAQAPHDLGVSAMWIWFQQNKPALITRWVGEDQLRAAFQGDSMPDAAITAPSDELALLLEFGGHYSRDRIAAFNEMAVSRQIPYQIW